MFIKFSLIVLLTGALFDVYGVGLDSLRTETHNGNVFILHQVDPGETLYSISKRYAIGQDVIKAANELRDHNIRIGQILSIPLKSEETESQTIVHTVKKGETLYALKRKYQVSLEDIKKWNNLKSENLSIGQQITIGGKARKIPAKADPVPFEGARKHFVQTGESLEQVGKQRNVHIDSLKKWNNLKSHDLRIGQILWYRRYDRSNDPDEVDVFGKKIEKGLARQIEGMEDSEKYLALHKTLPTGTLLEVRNLMNNRTAYVRVIGQLPATRLNEDVIVRLTPKSFKRLGILDARARVEITYYED